LKKSNRKKKPIKILKKPAGSVWFGFYKPKTEKTEPNLNRKKPSQNRQKTEPNWAKTEPNKKNQVKPVWTGFCPKKPNRTKTCQFEPVSVFLKKIQFNYYFL
jgi:hypothetical protein